MSRIGLLVPQECTLSESLESIRAVFDHAAASQRTPGRQSFPQIRLIGLTPEVQLYHGQALLSMDGVLPEGSSVDYIIIPALAGNLHRAMLINHAFGDWLREQYCQGKEITGVCTGSFLMGGIGLSSEEWSGGVWYRDRNFNKAYLRMNESVRHFASRRDVVVKNTGVYAWFDQLLRRLCNADIAAECAGRFAPAIDRAVQSIITIQKK